VLSHHHSDERCAILKTQHLAREMLQAGRRHPLSLVRCQAVNAAEESRIGSASSNMPLKNSDNSTDAPAIIEAISIQPSIRTGKLGVLIRRQSPAEWS